MNFSAPGHEALSDAELQRLASFLASIENDEAMTLEELDGFFCALIAGPDTVMPSEYLPVLFGGELPDKNAFASLEEANSTLSLIMRHWNHIAQELEQETVYLPLVGEPDERGVPAREWARGFMRGVALRRSGWVELFTNENEGQLMTIPLVAGEIDPEWPHETLTEDKREQLFDWMTAGLARSYRHFRRTREAATASAAAARRRAVRVGRNEPCPCGSGRKYKRCCGGPGSESRQ
jgi:uncharacterized protein